MVGKTEGKANPEWVEDLLGQKSYAEIQKGYPDFYALCVSIKEWLV